MSRLAPFYYYWMSVLNSTISLVTVVVKNIQHVGRERDRLGHQSSPASNPKPLFDQNFAHVLVVASQDGLAGSRTRVAGDDLEKVSQRSVEAQLVRQVDKHAIPKKPQAFELHDQRIGFVIAEAVVNAKELVAELRWHAMVWNF